MRTGTSSLPMLLLLLLGTVLSPGAWAEPAAKDRMPEIELKVPEAAPEREYLGLPTNGTFRIADIAADVLIIEVFNFYCPHCQRAAPGVNELYKLIQKRSDPKLRIKMIGIGAGNSPYEVNSFREKYGVPFPLFPDRDLTVTRLLEAQYTPTFIAVKLKGRKGGERFYTKESGFKDPQEFLVEVIKSAAVVAKE